VITSFKDQGTEDIFRGETSKAARKILPQNLHDGARRKLAYLDAAPDLRAIAAVPGLRLHALKGSLDGQHAVSINDQYRICFVWSAEGPVDVYITDYH
jgi:proteic killer suppression protein